MHHHDILSFGQGSTSKSAPWAKDSTIWITAMLGRVFIHHCHDGCFSLFSLNNKLKFFFMKFSFPLRKFGDRRQNLWKQTSKYSLNPSSKWGNPSRGGFWIIFDHNSATAQHLVMDKYQLPNLVLMGQPAVDPCNELVSRYVLPVDNYMKIEINFTKKTNTY